MPRSTPALQQALYVRDVIQQETPRTTAPMLAAFFKTLLIIMMVFVGGLVLSGYVRLYLFDQFQDEGLNTLTAISTSLLTLTLTYWASRWAERRFQGWYKLRQGIALVGRVRALDAAIEAVEQDNPAADDAALEARTQAAWDTYTHFVNTLNQASS